LPHYAKYLEKKPYSYGTHNAPWDIAVREVGTGKTRLETARSLGIKFNVGKQLSVDDGIETVRNMLPTCWIDEDRCQRLIEALRQYRKEWDEKNKCYKDKPLHDWTSHGADAVRTMAWTMKRRPKNTRAPPERAVSDSDRLAQSPWPILWKLSDSMPRVILPHLFRKICIYFSYMGML
jgi:hypothetical protein